MVPSQFLAQHFISHPSPWRWAGGGVESGCFLHAFWLTIPLNIAKIVYKPQNKSSSKHIILNWRQPLSFVLACCPAGVSGCIKEKNWKESIVNLAKQWQTDWQLKNVSGGKGGWRHWSRGQRSGRANHIMPGCLGEGGIFVGSGFGAGGSLNTATGIPEDLQQWHKAKEFAELANVYRCPT